MLEWLLLLLLPLAAACGWYAGFKYQASRNLEPEDHVTRDYLVGLNYLINERPDKAVDVFIKMLEVNSDTVETHLALGSLFRRRGEVERAIRIHQNLIARPQLTKEQRFHALSELGVDYLQAGMLDRAERVFLELIALGGEVATGFNHLLHIYQQQKDWKQAITVAEKIQAAESTEMPIAYYYCELAEKARLEGQIDEARDYLRQALAKDHSCVRAYILLGKLHQDAGAYKDAIALYRRVIEQDPDYLAEVVVPLIECYSKLDREDEVMGYLQERLEEFPRIALIVVLSGYIRKRQGDEMAINFIAQHLPRCLSLRGVAQLLDIYLDTADDATKKRLLLLKDPVEKLLKNKPLYRCVHCGFSSRQLYWQCPSCKRWAGIRPIHGVEYKE